MKPKTKILFLSIFIFIFLFSIESVYAKTVTERFYSNGYGDGQIEERAQNWEDIYYSDFGFNVVDVRETMHCGVGRHDSNGDYYLRRLFVPFNTFNIPGDAVIESASVNLFVSGFRRNNSEDNGNNYITLVQTTQASTTSLIVDDYDECGLVINPIEGIDIEERKNILDYFVDDHVVFLLNNIGRNWIQKGGWTKVGLRGEHDIEKSGPELGWGDDYWLGFYTTESQSQTHPYLEITYTIPDNPQIDPVILIPGIMGSWGKAGVWQMDPILHTYDGLVEAFLNAGYTENENFYTMPYDWRNDNVATAELLKNKIDLIKLKEEVLKVDLVAHSMGGLVARSYIQSGDYADDVDQMIFIDTPHQGAPESYLQYAGAYMPGIGGGIMKHVFEKEATGAGYDSLVKYIQEKIPTVGQLLPQYSYLMEKKYKEWEMRVYPYKTPVNSFLDDLNIADNVAILKERVSITGVYGVTEPEDTLTAVKVKKDRYKKDEKWKFGIPTGINMGKDRWQVIGAGDSTVAKSSLEFLHGGIDEVTFVGFDHSEVVTKAQKSIISTLTGEEPEGYFSSPFVSVKKVLMIAVKCPIDIQVIDPLGRVVGQDFDSGEEKNDVPGAFYSGADFAGEFVTIINPVLGEYIILVKGTAEGEYMIEMSLLSDGLGEAKKLVKKGKINSGEEEKFLIKVESGSNEVNFVLNNSIDKLLNDLEEINSSGEIKKQVVYRVLKAKFELAKKKYEQYKNETRDWKKKWLKRQLRFILLMAKTHLRFFEMRGWLDAGACDLLNSDIDEVVL